ncbi:MAG: hypothetical protein FWE16_03015 [Firmicutes bacterium]|nr:hypothetical protein [Bacillota bacterium]
MLKRVECSKVRRDDVLDQRNSIFRSYAADAMYPALSRAVARPVGFSHDMSWMESPTDDVELTYKKCMVCPSFLGKHFNIGNKAKCEILNSKKQPEVEVEASPE